MGAIPPVQAVKPYKCFQHFNELKSRKKKGERQIHLVVGSLLAILDFLCVVQGLNSNPMTAITILFKTGSDMSRFPSSKNFVS